MGEADLSDEVKAEKGEYRNPDGEVNLSVEKAPVVCLVSDAEELESEGNLDESEDYLY